MKLDELNLEELRTMYSGLELLWKQQLGSAHKTEDEIKKHSRLLEAKRTNDLRGKVMEEYLRQIDLIKKRS